MLVEGSDALQSSRRRRLAAEDPLYAERGVFWDPIGRKDGQRCFHCDHAAVQRPFAEHVGEVLVLLAETVEAVEVQVFLL